VVLYEACLVRGRRIRVVTRRSSLVPESYRVPRRAFFIESVRREDEKKGRTKGISRKAQGCRSPQEKVKAMCGMGIGQAMRVTFTKSRRYRLGIEDVRHKS